MNHCDPASRAVSQESNAHEESRMKRIKASLSACLDAYEHVNSKYPWRMNCFMAFFIASVGDLACQRTIHMWKNRDMEKSNPIIPHAPNLESSIIDNQLKSSNHGLEQDVSGHEFVSRRCSSHSTFNWDSKRTLDMGLIRALLVAPFIMVWFKFLRTIAPGGPLLNLFCRIIVDQGIGSPIVITLVFIGNQLLQWPNIPISMNIVNGLIENGPQTWMKGLQYNPFVNSINFAFVPLRHQPLYSHVAAIYWTAVMSYYSNKDWR